MSFSISGKTAIVTGAANGVGQAIARQFASKGANVMMADMDEATMAEEAGKQGNESSSVRYFAGDLREHLTRANLVSATIDAFETIDILVNASRQVLKTDISDDEDSSLDTLIRQNVICAYRLSLAVAKRMRSQFDAIDEDSRPVSAGSIINLSSVAAQRTRPDLLAYSVSAAASDQLTRSLALALAPQRIRVNSVAFGSVMSASLRDAIAEDDERRTRITEGTPLGRIAAPTELGDVAQFLASEASSFVTGHILTVDGGRSLVDAVNASAH